MDDVSEFLVGGQRASGSTFGVVLAIVAVLLATALMGYFVWCYARERRIRKRMERRAVRPDGGNVVPPIQELSETKRLKRKSSRTLPWPQSESDEGRVRRRRHPWKQKRFDSPTPR